MIEGLLRLLGLLRCKVCLQRIKRDQLIIRSRHGWMHLLCSPLGKDRYRAHP